MSAKPWPVGLSAREGILNATSGRWLPALIILATAAVTAVAGIANSVEVSNLVRAETAWIEAGGFTYVVEASGGSADASISVVDCERLRDVDGVGSAFALAVTDSTAWPSNAPGTTSTFATASSGIWGFFDLTPMTGQTILVTPAVTKATGLQDGEDTVIAVAASRRADAQRTEAVRAIALDSPSLPESLSGTLVSVELVNGRAQQCYVKTDAAHDEAVRGMLAGALAEGDSPASVRPRLSQNTYGVEFSTAYQARPLQWAWAAGAGVLGALWGVVRWTRRSRLAIYATFGADSRSRLVMEVAEWATLTGVGAVFGWATGLALSIGAGVDPEIAVVQTSGQVFAAWCAASIVTVVVSLSPVGTLIDALKDRT